MLWSTVIIVLLCGVSIGGHVRHIRSPPNTHQHPAGLNIGKFGGFSKEFSRSINLKRSLHEGHADEPCAVCPGTAACVPRVQCPAHLRAGAEHSECHLRAGRVGICCSTGHNHTSHSDLRKRTLSSISLEDLARAHQRSNMVLANLLEKEAQLLARHIQGTILSSSTPSFGQFQSNRVPDVQTVVPLGFGALQNLFATEALHDRQIIDTEQLQLGLINHPMQGVFCPAPPVCEGPSAKYYSLMGACNNLAHGSWGAANTAYGRIVPPEYSDGIWRPRLSVGGSPLPSARAVCSRLLLDVDAPSPTHNLMLMQFGQFIAHDTTSAVIMTFENGSAISCCAPDGLAPLPSELQHFGCDVILVQDTDSFYGDFGQTCMNFVRTQLAPSHDCSLGYAKQMNGVTHFLDMSQIYGSTEAKSAKLRAGVGGRLAMFHDFGRELPPLTSAPDTCVTMQTGSACFDSGDEHVNQMLSLVAMHLVWIREHNRVAASLARLNPEWDDQILFFEARRIVIAEMQHILYNEWLPLIVGEDTMHAFNLRVDSSDGYFTDYDPNTNPSLTSEFAVAAFRFGHSIVDGKLKIPKDNELYEAVAIPEVMFQPSRMRLKHYFDRMLNGLTQQPMQQSDSFITHALSRYMFHGGNPFGLDLASINVMRGRDHGLPGYNHYRKLMGLPTFATFAEFGDAFGESLSDLYLSPDDVDLWIGGLLESPAPSAIVGDTFRDIIADQFSRLRKGDRYFYEHGPEVNPGAFTPGQLSELRRSTMARIICDNSDGPELQQQPLFAFLLPSAPGNQMVPCSSNLLPTVDLTLWRGL